MPYRDSDYPSILRGRDKRASQRLLEAAPEMLTALHAAADFLAGHNECIGDGNDPDWVDYCLSLHSQCKYAIAKAEGRE